MANLDEIQIKISQDSNDASKAIDSLISSLEKLSKATDLGKTAENIKSLSGSVDSLSDASKKLEKIDFGSAMKGIGTTTLGALKGLAGWGVSLTVIGKQLSNSVGLASKYTQTVNMLNTVMGEGAEEAKEFAENLGNTLGLNPADVMNFQATFQNLFVGFGNNAKQAQIMSKNLTQLSYDMASFYEQLGGDPQAAAEKLRLAMAGTIEPIQRLGYAIKEADLQAVAARQGLNVNIRNLNTASKSMLRYIAIMEQSQHVQGYMVKSLDSPTTALMIFQSAIKQLSTEIGKTFLPMLMAAIPYIYAFVSGVLNMVKTINGILGIELPTIEGWDETKEGISGIGSEAEETGKKIQKAFSLGIDELNVLDSSAADAGAGFQDITKYLKLPEYDMLEGFSGEKIKDIEEKLKPLEPLFNGMAEAFAGFYDAVSWLAGDVFYPWLVSIGEWMKENPDTMNSLGKGLAYVGAGLLIIKGVGSLAKLLMIPELISGLQTTYSWLKEHNVGWKDVGKTLGLVFAAAVIVFGAYKLLESIMNIILDIGDPFVNAREGAAGLAYVIGGALLAAFISAGGWTLALASGMALATGYIIDNWTDVSANIRDTFSTIYKSFIEFAYQLQRKWIIFTYKLQLNWRLAMNNMNGAMLKMLKDFLLSANPIVKLIMEVTGADEKIDSFIDKITLSDEEKENEKDIRRDIIEDMVLELEGLEEARDTLTLATEKLEQASDAAYIKEKEKEEQTKKESEAISFGNKFSAMMSGEFDKFSREQTEELKSGFGDIKEEISTEITKELSNIQIPSVSTGTSEEVAASQEEVAANTAATNEVLGETKDLQTVANELAAASNLVQSEFNTNSLANEEEIAKTLDTANNLKKTSTSDITSVVKGIGSEIISALRQVEDACRNIKIEVHKHYGGGGDGYATGGFPTSGEYFFAREDGLPEMVGRVGRQTAVMNNGQIADTMAQSLVKAMGQGAASQSPTVIENKLYLDGEVVYNNQQRIQRSKGYNLGMGVFANV